MYLRDLSTTTVGRGVAIPCGQIVRVHQPRPSRGVEPSDHGNVPQLFAGRGVGHGDGDEQFEICRPAKEYLRDDSRPGEIIERRGSHTHQESRKELSRKVGQREPKKGSGVIVLWSLFESCLPAI